MHGGRKGSMKEGRGEGGRGYCCAYVVYYYDYYYYDYLSGLLPPSVVF